MIYDMFVELINYVVLLIVSGVYQSDSVILKLVYSFSNSSPI